MKRDHPNKNETGGLAGERAPSPPQGGGPSSVAGSSWPLASVRSQGSSRIAAQSMLLRRVEEGRGEEDRIKRLHEN